MNKIKVLVTSKNLGLNGISTIIMNYCRNIDLSKFEITIIAGLPINDLYKEELEKLHISIIELPNKDKSIKNYYKTMYKKIKYKYYDIIHSHGNSSILSIEMFIALLKNIKTRIVHSHNTTCKNLLIHKFLSLFLRLLYTQGFSCSNSSGKWLFKNCNYKVIPNGIEIDRYTFNNNHRKEIRKKLKITDKDFLIGHIGEFNNIKNQEFLIDIMRKLLKENINIYLILVGSGPNFDYIRNIIKLEKLEKNIILYNETIEVSKIYSAMDLFLLPSKYEGLPFVLLEAQVNGLHCIISSNISKEVDITKNIEFLSINDNSFDKWIKSIKKQINKKRKNINKYNIKIQKYNIKNNVKELEKTYIDLLK